MIEDPRIHNIVRNLSSIRNVYAVVSSKGGVGKSTVSTLLALHASRRFETGLLDIDFTNPSTHILLNLNPGELKYEEEKGILPYDLKGLKYFSIVAYTMDKPLPLRGEAARSALRELLAIVKWGRLKLLFIDTPPGMSDEHLDLVYMLRDIVKPIVVSTPSILSVKSAARLVSVLREAGFKWIGFIENMGNESLRGNEVLGDVEYLGYIPYTPGIESCLGSRMVEACIDPGLLDSILSRLIEL
ncbi:P-loop NTPase [Desulfurococcus amylolyticus]|uniref:P-loop NTPase n=1 Tax=Desulfurococcus amylolyticus TaxID=94694 RepID=UPI0023F04E07|nr:P-loop NTPase [Desulfurococcus amylolyticus]